MQNSKTIRDAYIYPESIVAGRWQGVIDCPELKNLLIGPLRVGCRSLHFAKIRNVHDGAADHHHLKCHRDQSGRN